MNSGLWALIGVCVGASLNLLVWIIQFRYQKTRERWIIACEKFEELARLLTQTDNLFKQAMTESLRTLDLVSLWKEKNFWADLEMVRARVIVLIYFQKALDLFDQMQGPILNFAEEIARMLAHPGFGERSELVQYYDRFVTARSHFFEKCHQLLER